MADPFVLARTLRVGDLLNGIPITEIIQDGAGPDERLWVYIDDGSLLRLRPDEPIRHITKGDQPKGPKDG